MVAGGSYALDAHPVDAVQAVAAAASWLAGSEMKHRHELPMRAASFFDAAVLAGARAHATPASVNTRGEEAVGVLRRWLLLVRAPMRACARVRRRACGEVAPR